MGSRPSFSDGSAGRKEDPPPPRGAPRPAALHTRPPPPGAPGLRAPGPPGRGGGRAGGAAGGGERATLTGAVGAGVVPAPNSSDGVAEDAAFPPAVAGVVAKNPPRNPRPRKEKPAEPAEAEPVPDPELD